MPESEVAGPPPGFLVTPQRAGPWPGIVMIHEAYGLNDNIRDLARRYAAEGYAVHAVDLFAGRSRVVCMARFFVGSLRGATNLFGIDELRAALEGLGRQPGVDGNRVGAVGYCMGGGLAIAWAVRDDRLRAIAPYYGINPRPLEAVRRSCPVVGSYPSRDFTAGAGRKLEAALDRFGVPHDIKIYEGAKHSFCNAGGGSYDPAAAEDSFQRVLAFFGEHIAAA
jgi:carboxymethylenebutenolidase